MEAIWLIILAGIVGGAARSVLGFLSEAEPNEKFSWTKFGKTLARAVIGGAILGYWLALDFKAVFFAAFFSDVGSKAVWDIIKEKTK